MLNSNKSSMSVDREEIRWKFQIFLENIRTVMTWAENQRNILSDTFDKESREIEKSRNYWLAGIGFTITIGASLIISDKIELFYSFYLLIAAAIGLAIFVITNLYIFKRLTKQNQINFSYFEAINGELLPLIGDITTHALNESYKKEDLNLIQNYISSYTIAISFDISKTIYNTLKLGGFDKEKFQDGYLIGKNNLENFKNFNFKLGTKRIEKFVEEFEK